MAETKKRTAKAEPKHDTVHAESHIHTSAALSTNHNAPNTAFRTHGRTFTGIVVSDKMSRTVTVAWDRRQYVPKYQRYERRYSKVKAHNPADIDAKTGEKVMIMETRPISKTKHFIVIKKL